jgi:hypothetical protein
MSTMGALCVAEDAEDKNLILDGQKSLYECKTSCSRTSFCHGVEFRDDNGQCKIVMSPVSSTKRKTGSRCLKKGSAPTSSLFCFALMIPWSDERKLLKMQFENRWGIFACDESMVYSSPVQDLGGVKTGVIDMDLHCEKGGPPGLTPTVLNQPVFENVWNTVIKDGYFRAHEWTVKVDPDTVFLPRRVRKIVQSVPQDALAQSGMVLKNCKLGLHGPIEVISRRALELYSGGNANCERPGQEDVYMEKCLASLGVNVYMQENVLAEGECMRGDYNANPLWYFCNSSHAAFHPLKTESEFRDCLINANAAKFQLA